MKHNIHIVYDETYSGGGICEGQENDEWPSHDEQIIDYSPRYASFTIPKDESFDLEDIETETKDLPLVYGVLAIYSDGDTFGQTSGYHRWCGIYATREAAEAACSAVRQGNFTATALGEYFYAPWDGYFSSLQSLEVQALEVR